MIKTAAAALAAATLGNGEAVGLSSSKGRNQPFEVRGVHFGGGRTKLIVSLTEQDLPGTLGKAKRLAESTDVDVVEFRLDHLDEALNARAVADMVPQVAGAIAGKPLIVTFRTTAEGGEKYIAPDSYARLYAAVLASGAGDLFDIQSSLLAEPMVAALLGQVQAQRRFVILSHHDFHRTPDVVTMHTILREQQAKGADICKLAVMPRDTGDVLRLLQATWQTRQALPGTPLITMAMGGLGAVSRLSGETFGSNLSFGSLGESSAPGQIEAGDLAATLKTVHNELKLRAEPTIKQ